MRKVFPHWLSEDEGYLRKMRSGVHVLQVAENHWLSGRGSLYLTSVNLLSSEGG